MALYDASPEALERGLAGIRRQYESQVKKGRIGEAEAARRLALIRAAEGLAEAADGADAVVEAVFEDPEVKREVFRALDEAARPGALLATDTRRWTSTTSPPQQNGPNLFSACTSSVRRR